MAWILSGLDNSESSESLIKTSGIILLVLLDEGVVTGTERPIRVLELVGYFLGELRGGSLSTSVLFLGDAGSGVKITFFCYYF